jgi:hypothetical protein
LHVTTNCGNTLLPAGVLVHRVCKPLSLLSLAIIFSVVLVCVSGVLIFLSVEKKFEIRTWVGFASSFKNFGLCAD